MGINELRNESNYKLKLMIIVDDHSSFIEIKKKKPKILLN